MSDALLERYVSERSRHVDFIEEMTRSAAEDDRDLTDSEQEQIKHRHERIAQLDPQIDTLQAQAKVRSASAATLDTMHRGGTTAEVPEYKTPGEFIADMWQGGAGVTDAQRRLNRYMNRVAAHITTADNLGVVPAPILGPIIEFLDASRPLVNAVGISPLTNGPSFFRPHVTQHTQVGKQAAEKDELVSRKLTLERKTVTVETWGGYVNVSRQFIDWSVPNGLDIVVRDLAAQYAIETEKALGAALVTAATDSGASIATPDADKVTSAIWTAAGKVYAGTKGVGRIVVAVSPDMLGTIGAFFPGVLNAGCCATGSGFDASTFGTGLQGNLAGASVVVSAGLATGTVLVMSTGAAEVYEQRIGTLQVTEPSVLGVQVAYAGYFAPVVLEATGIQKIATS
jgi:HK97 family phage major capsid protein